MSYSRQVLTELQKKYPELNLTALEKVSEDDWTDIDNTLKNRLYPDKHVTYSRVFNYKKCMASFALTSLELQIITIMVSFMSQKNMVAISRETLIKFTDFSESSVKRAIRKLKQNGFIGVVMKGKKNHPTIYIVNPELAVSGKGISMDDFRLYGSDTAFTEVNKNAFKEFPVNTKKISTKNLSIEEQNELAKELKDFDGFKNPYLNYVLVEL